MGNIKWVATLFATQVLQTHLLRFFNNLISKIKFKEKHTMSTNKDLFKEAIADAKQVREAALVNAKAALEEALTPKLHSMLAAKLEEMNDNNEEETLEEVDLISANDRRNDSDIRRKRAIDAGQMSEGEEELEEDFDLSAILAELDSEESIAEAKKEDEEKMDEAKEETEEEETEDEESEEETETEMEDETEEDIKITDLTVDELKDIIKDIISAEMGAEADMEMGAEDEMADMGGEEEMAVDLGGEEAGMEIGAEEEIDEVDLDELLAELDALDGVDEDPIDEAKKKDAKEKDEKNEMKEAIETIEALRNELHEQNLLNAKLLYVNKIFKAKNLTESQKVKVIASFDKATTPAQAKELFESIQNSEIGAKKEIVKESLGFASKAAGIAPKKVIVESNDVISRMQKLANIK